MASLKQILADTDRWMREHRQPPASAVQALWEHIERQLSREDQRLLMQRGFIKTLDDWIHNEREDAKRAQRAEAEEIPFEFRVEPRPAGRTGDISMVLPVFEKSRYIVENGTMKTFAEITVPEWYWLANQRHEEAMGNLRQEAFARTAATTCEAHMVNTIAELPLAAQQDLAKQLAARDDGEEETHETAAPTPRTSPTKAQGAGRRPFVLWQG